MQNVHKTVLTKSRKMCSVPRCSSYCTTEVSLHRFPKDTDLCSKWMHLLSIDKLNGKYMLVCSLHFTESDYFLNKKVLRRLKKGAVPSRNLPVSQNDSTHTKINSANRKSLTRENSIVEVVNSSNQETDQMDVEIKVEMIVDVEEEIIS